MRLRGSLGTIRRRERTLPSHDGGEMARDIGSSMCNTACIDGWMQDATTISWTHCCKVVDSFDILTEWSELPIRRLNTRSNECAPCGHMECAMRVWEITGDACLGSKAISLSDPF